MSLISYTGFDRRGSEGFTAGVAPGPGRGSSKAPPTRFPLEKQVALLNLLKLLDRPIAFHRSFVPLTGSINAALMLSQCVYWSTRTTLADGWFYKTQEEWSDETGLTRRELDTARRVLRELRVLKEQKRGVPAKVFYQLQAEVMHQMCIPDWRKAPTCDGGKRQRNTETTQRLLLPPEDEDVVLRSADEEKSTPEEREVIHRLFQFYLEQTGRNGKMYTLTKERMKRGILRLRDCKRKTDGNLAKAEGLMAIVIESLVESEFHMGKNDQKRAYVDWIDHLFKSTEKLEWWLDR